MRNPLLIQRQGLAGRSGVGVRALLLAAALLVFPVLAGASSQIILIDFGTDPNEGVFGDDPTWNNPSGNWNIISAFNGSTVNLVDENGDGTGIGMVRADFDPLVAGFPGIWNPLNQDFDWIPAEAGYDGFTYTTNGGTPPDTASITLTGLDDSAEYTVEVVSTFPGPNFDRSDYTLDGEYGTRTYLFPNAAPGTVGLNWSPAYGFIQGDWMFWENVTSAAGEVTIEVHPGIHPPPPDTPIFEVGIINAMRITRTSVPEPAGAALFMLAAGFLIRRSRGRLVR